MSPSGNIQPLGQVPEETAHCLTVNHGEDCLGPAAYHILLAQEDPDARGNWLKTIACQLHEHMYQRRGLIQHEHAWRAAGSACGVTGAIWNVDTNRCESEEPDAESEAMMAELADLERRVRS